MEKNKTFNIMKKETSKEELIRKKAIEWWNSLSLYLRNYFNYLYFNSQRKLSTLTGREIEEIFIKQKLYCISSNAFVYKQPCKNWCGDINCLKSDDIKRKKSIADEIIELVGKDNFKQIIKESDERVNNFKSGDLVYVIQLEQPFENWVGRIESSNGNGLYNVLNGVDDVVLIKESQLSLVESNKKQYSKEELKGFDNFKKVVNIKQFEQFDESLFKAYINKFSDEDKLNALKVLFWSLKSEQKFHIIEIGIDKI